MTSPQSLAASVLLAVCLIAQAIHIPGGGLVVPPYQSIAWVLTPNVTYSIFGICPRNPSIGFFELNPQWKTLQGQCQFIFPNSEAPPMSLPVTGVDALALTIRVDNIQSIIVFTLHAAAAVLIFVVLAVGIRRNYRSSTILAIMAFLFQGVGFALAVYNFYTLIVYQLQPKNIAAGFGASIYIDGAVTLLLVISAALIYSGGRAKYAQYKAPGNEGGFSATI
ncbi:hypothetical protein BJ742DRAFT_811316 [Cladochytrium replicatum]|nr:hypothetical protein BJ742DRAFT_811316 [Cladochytrium replicatum]